MSFKLRDTHSYEVQIIDAVRSVNKALGGTYGTSSAIHKSEFNQYEVQLIDAIKGIGRTLSGNGLSLAGGGSLEGLQDLAKRVTQLERESFFRLVNGNVTLKEAYSNLWVPGWLAAGGVGTSGGGGGVSYLRQLEDVYHDDYGILRANGDPVENGDVLVYSSVGSTWVAAANSASGTVTNYGDITTQRIATVGTVDIYNSVKWGSAGQTANTFQLTVNGTTKTVCLEGYSTGGGGGAYTLGTQTAAAAAKGTMLGVNAISNDLSSTGSESSLIEWDSTNSAWHFLGNIYSDGWIAAGGTGTPGGGGGGIDLAAMWASLTNSVADAYASTKINIAHIPNLTVSMITDWANVYTLRTPVSTTAANGVLLGVDALSNASSSVSGSDSTRIEWDSTNTAWRVRGNLYADGWIAAGGIGSGGGGGGATSLSGLTDVNDNLSPAAKNVLWYDSTNSIWDAHALTLSDISNVSLSSLVDGQYLAWDATNQRWGNASPLLRTLLDVDVTPSSAYDGYVLTYQNSGMKFVLTPGGGGGAAVSYTDLTGSAGTVKIGTISVGSTDYDVYTYPSGGSYTLPIASSSTLGGIKVGSGLSINSTTGVLSVTGGGGGGSTVSVTQVLTSGTKIATITVDNVDTDLYAPSGGGGGGTGYIGTTEVQSSSAAQALTGILSINATSSSSSTSRIVWESGNNAWHFYGNLYADGFVAAGGVGSDSLVKFVQCTQTQYNNLSTKDSSTIYYVTGTTTKVYLGSIQLSN